MNQTEIEVSEIINKGIEKLVSAKNITNNLKLDNHRSNKFIVTNLLDWYVSQISPRLIAEYHNLRDKGKV